MKKLIFIVTLSIFSFLIYAQDSSSQDSQNPTQEEITNSQEQEIKESDDIFFFGNLFQPPKSLSEFTGAMDFVMEFEPGISINTASRSVSAPSPIIYPITFGFLWPDYTFLAAQPSVSFFMNNHLWYNGKALPAEIENRTSTTLSFLFNIPAVLSFYIKNFRLQLMPGIAILARFAFLANNINASDSGYSGSAASDIKNINSYFWSNGRFFYLSSGVSILYKITDTIKIGPVMNVYVPIIPLLTGEGLQATIISLGVKISL